jgi:hypothetical protein
MCQFSSNCKNFQPPKDKKANQSNCVLLCNRNPLLQYTIPDRLLYIKKPRRGDADAYAEDEMEFSPLSINDLIVTDDFQEKIKEIEASETMTSFQKTEAVKQVEMEKAITESQDLTELDTQNLETPEAGRVKEKFEKTDFAKAQDKALEEAVEESTNMENYRHLVPRRKRRR